MHYLHEATLVVSLRDCMYFSSTFENISLLYATNPSVPVLLSFQSVTNLIIIIAM